MPGPLSSDLDRQVYAREQARNAPGRIYLDKSGATTDRPGYPGALEYAGDVDGIVVQTVNRLGRTGRQTAGLVHDLARCGVGIRNLADPINSRSVTPVASRAAALARAERLTAGLRRRLPSRPDRPGRSGLTQHRR